MTGRNCKILCYRKNVFDLLLHMANIFDKLNSKKYCINYYYNKILNLLVELFTDINILHSFCEWNVWMQKRFMEELSMINGIDLNITNIERNIIIIKNYYYSMNEKFYGLEKIKIC